MEPVLLFLLFVAVLLIVLSTGVPVGVALGVIGVLGTLYFASPAQLGRLAQISFTRSTDFVLIVIPLFVLMGEVLSASRIGRDVYVAAERWFGKLPGALAIGTVWACAGFGAVCGSSPVTAATIGSMAVPEMERHGYDKRLALGATSAGGTLGILIPPSVAMILYGTLTETSIGRLFIAGILPGLLLAGLLSLTIVIRVLLNPKLAPPVPSVTWAERWQSAVPVWPIGVLFVLVMGSIYSGIATPTEAAAVGAMGAIAVSLILRRFNVSTFLDTLVRSVKTSAMFLLLLVGGLFASFVLTRVGIPQGMAAFLTQAGLEPVMVILLINVALIILGMFLDPLSILVITLPIFFPTVVALGYDPVWFGVIVTINTEIAAITPPVGFNLFVLKAAIPGVQLGDVIAGSLQFIVPMVVAIVLLIAFPQIALFLPSLR